MTTCSTLDPTLELAKAVAKRTRSSPAVGQEANDSFYSENSLSESRESCSSLSRNSSSMGSPDCGVNGQSVACNGYSATAPLTICKSCLFPSFDAVSSLQFASFSLPPSLVPLCECLLLHPHTLSISCSLVSSQSS